jgi:SpoVK/Ycf46/Vps4 family AAA+-type ATPase
MAQRLPSIAAWNDLVLPIDVKARLEELCHQARLQHTVLVDGGFGRRLARGRGVTGLFCGPSGTGKTMAAEVIAHRLGRELYRVDFARVVSKYIGETERNLRQIFTEAERARCVLFFDEADALFGKRTEIRDSHDRYANLEVSYLLQLFEEAEHAVVLLATNRRQGIDDAFARRFRFVVDFPMPNAALRRELWRTSFSAEMPLDESVRVDVLADRLPLSGASIRNIALASAFLAVSEHDGAPAAIGAEHIVSAALREMEKLSSPMPVTAADITAAPKPLRRAAR